MKKFTILGYGAGDVPFLKGVEMATATDQGYANDIAYALAHKHIGQWFGVSAQIDDGPLTFGSPIRLTLLTDK